LNQGFRFSLFPHFQILQQIRRRRAELVVVVGGERLAGFRRVLAVSWPASIQGAGRGMQKQGEDFRGNRGQRKRKGNKKIDVYQFALLNLSYMYKTY